MNAKKIKYILRQAFQSVWRNKIMALAAISSVAAVLIILGYIIMIVLNVNNITTITSEEFDKVVVYIKKDVAESNLAKIEEDLNKIEGVNTVLFKPKKQALEEVKEQWGDNACLLEGLRRNPLPDSFIIRLKDISLSDKVISILKKNKNIEDIRCYEKAIDVLINVSTVIKKIGIFIVIILLLISVFIISNIVKITVGYRKKEIELMQYIGASNGYVRGPFVLEGVILSFFGAMLAIGIISLSYSYFVKYITEYFVLVSGFSNYIVSYKVIFKDIFIIFVTIGAGIGMVGSLISIKKFLNV